MFEPFSLRLADLDEALGFQHELLERMLYKMVVARLIREAAASEGIEAHRQLEAAAARVTGAGIPCAALLALMAPGRESMTEDVGSLVETAPEPYRTMLVDHRARFIRMWAELGASPNGADHDGVAGDSLGRELDEVVHRAARGALAGSVSPTLGAFIDGHTSHACRRSGVI